jgi:hypothetical protein
MEGAIVPTSQSENDLEKQMTDTLSRGYGPKIARFAMALLGGAIPLVGGAVAGAAGAWSEAEQDHFNRVAASWRVGAGTAVPFWLRPEFHPTRGRL